MNSILYNILQNTLHEFQKKKKVKQKLTAKTTAKSTTARQKSSCLAAIFYLLDLSQTKEVCLYKMDKSIDLVPQLSHVQIEKLKSVFHSLEVICQL